MIEILTAAAWIRLNRHEATSLIPDLRLSFGETKPVTLTGWFSDDGCARGRAASGNISPNNPECVKQCLDKGARAVFISEQGKEMLIVTGYAKADDDLGYHIEITGIPDLAAKSISVQTVTRTGEYEDAACARPKKK